MPRIPSRESFAALTAAANAIAPVAMLGLVRRQGPDSLSLPYADSNGLGGHILETADVAEVFQPPATEPRHGPIDRLLSNRQGAVESHLTFVGVQYIVDDLSTHPFEATSPHRPLKMRSSLRLPIRLGGKGVAGLNFMSLEAARYTSEDVLIGRRIAEHVALALSHFRLAEDAREAAALRERTGKLELLDCRRH